MRSSLLPLQAEARKLARNTAAPSQKLRISSQTHSGNVARSQTGTGENFWQYRQYMPGDNAASIDWRRSARANNFFIREHELERPRYWRFWLDPSTGFDWSSKPSLPHKAERAIVLIMAMVCKLSQSGEQCSTLDKRQKIRKNTAEQLGHILWKHPHQQTFPPHSTGGIPILTSDFYANPQKWQRHIHSLAAKSRRGMAIAIADPVEADFPFNGRTQLFMPGSNTLQPQLYGRIETIKKNYLEIFAQRRQQLRTLLTELGWMLIEDRTDQPPHHAFQSMIAAYTHIRSS